MKGNVLLIVPAVNPASQSKTINSIIVKTLPTSVGILAGFLDGRGLGLPRIIDEQINAIQDKDLPEIIASLEPPRIIGITVITIGCGRAYDLAEKIKKIDPKAMIILGGIHPTVLPEEAFQNGSVDIVVRGEGEETLLYLVQAINNQMDFTKIDGISFRSNGNVIHNPNRPLIKNLDEIPPFPYRLFEDNISEYPSFGSIISSRGCPYNCIFCSSRSISGRKYRYFSVERTVREIELLVNTYNQETIWFMDDNLGVNSKRFDGLLDGIIKRGLHRKARFIGSMRGDNVTDEILDKAKAANFGTIACSLETGSEKLMSILNKGETVEKVAKAIRKIDRKGISTSTSIIFGLPEENRRDRWKAIRLVRDLPLSSARFNTLTPYPGTPVYEMLNDQGKLLIKRNWANFAVQYMWEGDDLPYVPDGNYRYELMFDTMYANLSFYLSIKGIKGMIKAGHAGSLVINMQKKWYLCPKTILRFLKVFFYLSRRFVYITVKMISEKCSRWFRSRK